MSKMNRSREELIALFMELGMSDKKAEETFKNATLTKHLTKSLDEFTKLTGQPKPTDKRIFNLFYALASKLKPNVEHHLPLLVEYIVNGKIDGEVRLAAALKYLLEHLKDTTLNVPEFEAECGVGIVVTQDDIENIVKVAIEQFKDELLANRYRFNIGRILGHIRGLPNMVWADGNAVKNEVELRVRLLLGPKTEDDLKSEAGKSAKPAVNVPKSKTEPKTVKTTVSNAPNGDSKAVGTSSNEYSFDRIGSMLKKLPLHLPGQNFTSEGYPSSKLALKLLDEHVKRTKGQVRTRFPPEPNGILHIGHAKAININFGYAKVNDGICFLRYDDTNPEKEEERFFHSILDMVNWLGYTPYKVTHASDYFDQLYEWALVLISKGLAYVCHQKADELKGFNPPPSPWRDRSPEENLYLFQEMKNGKLEEGSTTLRMKVTLEEGKQDPVAYRIRYVPHPKSGNKWCIYPTYDFTHCLCDSVEDITHSLCTKEFQNRRSSYYWLCEAVEAYIPVQWEYGRLNMCYTVVSKRKIAKLIDEKIVNDWDDPRLYTLPALRRRGFPPEALNDFCVRMGITGAVISVDPAMIDACVRDVLNVTAPRTMVVLKPIKVIIDNFSDVVKDSTLKVHNFPADPNSPTHPVAFENVVFIDHDDFKEKADKGYKRFALDQSVGLCHTGFVLSCTNAVKDASGSVTELHVTAQPVGTAQKPKGFIHWVSKPVEIEIRLYDRLFKHKNPEDKAEVPDGFLSDCNDNTLKIEKALADRHLLGCTKPFTQYQFERIGYFSIDPDTKGQNLVFNRTVTLREDSGKN